MQACSTHYFKRLLGYASIALAFSSCALLFGGPQSTSIELPLAASLPSERLSESPFLYRLSAGAETTYLTAIQDCQDKRPNTLSSTRRLLVGLKQLRIRAQSSEQVLGHNLLVSLIDAELDSQPIQLISLSAQVENCVKDFVLWSAASKDSAHLEARKSEFLQFLSENPALLTDPA